MRQLHYRPVATTILADLGAGVIKIEPRTATPIGIAKVPPRLAPDLGEHSVETCARRAAATRASRRCSREMSGPGPVAPT